MKNLVIFGAPGSGKGTQSQQLIQRYGLHHISTGDTLRSHIARHTPQGKIAEGYISQGHLIPDDLMVDILRAEIDDNPERVAHGVIFDGFPRTIAQAEALDKMLSERGLQVDAVIGLEVPEEELIERLLKRGKDSGRSDDNLPTIQERLKVYHGQTAPLKDYYERAGKYRRIQGSGALDKIASDINDAVDKL